MRQAIFIFKWILIIFAFIQQSHADTMTYIQPTKTSAMNYKRLNSYVNQNSVYVEAFGRGGLYTLGYEYSPSPRISMGIGYSYQSLNLNPTLAQSNTLIQLLPIYAQFYFPIGSHRPFISTGATFVSIKSETDFDVASLFRSLKISYQDPETERSYNAQIEAGSGVQADVNALIAVPNLATGYEYKVSSNSFFRGTLLAMLLNKPTAWAGLTVGVGF